VSVKKRMVQKRMMDWNLENLIGVFSAWISI
jgi:hypothetical protein